MESPVLVVALAACAGAAAVVLVVAVLRSAGSRRSRAELEARVVAAEQEVDDLRTRLDALMTRQEEPQGADFVITHVGEPEEEPAAVAVPDRLVLSATLGEPLVKAAAFSHGVRRALSARSRNRIWFEVRREVRASRRRRRQLRKRLEREYRARLRTEEQAVEGSVLERPA